MIMDKNKFSGLIAAPATEALTSEEKTEISERYSRLAKQDLDVAVQQVVASEAAMSQLLASNEQQENDGASAATKVAGSVPNASPSEAVSNINVLIQVLWRQLAFVLRRLVSTGATRPSS